MQVSRIKTRLEAAEAAAPDQPDLRRLGYRAWKQRSTGESAPEADAFDPPAKPRFAQSSAPTGMAALAAMAMQNRAALA